MSIDPSSWRIIKDKDGEEKKTSSQATIIKKVSSDSEANTESCERDQFKMVALHLAAKYDGNKDVIDVLLSKEKK